MIVRCCCLALITMRIRIFCIALLLILSSSLDAQDGFPFPNIPSELTEPLDRRDYLLQHYWDKYDFTDSLLAENVSVTEQGMSDFLFLLGDESLSTTIRLASIDSLCVRLVFGQNSTSKISELVEDYLYEPESPVYNEPLYAEFLSAFMDCDAFGELDKLRFGYYHSLVSRNQVGSVATAFEYFTPEGKPRSFPSSVITETAPPLTLLIFYDPDCQYCHRIITALSKDGLVSVALSQGQLQILAIYAGSDTEHWQRELPNLPSEWSYGCDHGSVMRLSLYNLRDLPCLYLLDSSAHVLLKDASLSQLRNHLSGCAE